jgi:dihydroorotase
MCNKNKIFTNCFLFFSNPSRILENQFLFIKSGLINKFGNMKDLSPDDLHDCEISNVVDCDGLLVSPGLIDVHVHFRDPGFKFKEDIKSGSESAIAGGFTTVVCQPNTKPNLDNLLTIEYLKKQISENSKVNIKFYSSATRSSLGKEIVSAQSMVKAGAIGFTDDGLPIANSKIMMDLLRYSAFLNVPIAQHAEDLDITNGGCVHHGRFAQQFSLPTIHPASEYSVIARDISLLESIPEARYHVLHVSCEKSLDYIRSAKAKNLRITSEITPHHFVATDELLYENLSMAKMNPPLRSQNDLDAMVRGMQDGTIDIIASDHAPHDAGSKEQSVSCASFGIIGLETMLPLSLELYHKNLLPLERILEMLTVNPAKLINENSRGSIEVGNIADLAIIDINYEWTIDSSKMLSKSKNTPFNGRKVRGKNMATIIDGEIVYCDEEWKKFCFANSDVMN